MDRGHGIPRSSRARTADQKRQELDKIQKYRDLGERIRALTSRPDYDAPEVFQLTSKLLKLNPEYYTVWNIRRRILISGGFLVPPSPASTSTATNTPAAPPDDKPSTDTAPSASSPDAAMETAPEKKNLEVLQSELGFTIPLLQEHPKCYWIWNYRLWALGQVTDRLPQALARRIWQEELGLASKMLSRDQRNFHAWGYRRHLVAQLESPGLAGTSMVESEFEYTTKMIRVNLSNFSAWHNRAKLVPRLLAERKADDVARRAFLEQELEYVRGGLDVGPEDQSLWYYHQFLVLNLLGFLPDSETIAPGLDAEDRVGFVVGELANIENLLEDFENEQLIYEALVDYTLGLCQFAGRKPSYEERASLREWLAQLKKSDPMRMGRWVDVEREWDLATRP